MCSESTRNTRPGTVGVILQRQKTIIMDWDELKREIYLWDGSWRDIYIPDTTKEDWSKWVDFVNSNYKIDWFNGKTEQDENKVDINLILELWDGNYDLRSTAHIFIDHIQINSHFFHDEAIENDIDPREFNSIDDHNKLIGFMKGLSKCLSRKVILTPENQHEIILLTVDADSVVIEANINPIG